MESEGNSRAGWDCECWWEPGRRWRRGSHHPQWDLNTPPVEIQYLKWMTEIRKWSLYSEAQLSSAVHFSLSDPSAPRKCLGLIFNLRFRTKNFDKFFISFSVIFWDDVFGRRVSISWMTVGDMKRKVVHYLHHSLSLGGTGRRDGSGVSRGAVDVPGQGGRGSREGRDTAERHRVANRISADHHSPLIIPRWVTVRHCNIIR